MTLSPRPNPLALPGWGLSHSVSLRNHAAPIGTGPSATTRWLRPYHRRTFPAPHSPGAPPSTHTGRPSSAPSSNGGSDLDVAPGDARPPRYRMAARWGQSPPPPSARHLNDVRLTMCGHPSGDLIVEGRRRFGRGGPRGRPRDGRRAGLGPRLASRGLPHQIIIIFPLYTKIVFLEAGFASPVFSVIGIYMNNFRSGAQKTPSSRRVPEPRRESGNWRGHD